MSPIVVLGWALICWLTPDQIAEGATAESNTAGKPPISVEDLSPSNSKGYASVAFGNGILYGSGINHAKPMRWRDGELRFGQPVDIFGLVSSGHIPTGEAPRFDVVYYNEGHPDNNHRDGYALQVVLRKSLRPDFSAEFGMGPYFSMNRTTINGTEIDDARVGAMFSLALLIDLDKSSSGLHLRAGYTHILMPGAPSSDALFIGVGKEIGPATSDPPNKALKRTIWFGATGGFAQTNQSGPGKRPGYSLDAKSYANQWATSFSAIKEGDDGVRVNRQGVAAQQWTVQRINENWAISAGAGPYLAVNKRQSDNWRLMGLVTIALDRDLGNDWKAIASFRRVVTFQNRNDVDLMTIGLMKRFSF
ncbi:hypothetical protein [Glaciimonas immobilis]|uniref:Uncharacterized protein n=1 Tax=Glaciimonas immobilis TaxID=728004 RepID=A0A840RR55_9BURK|nr:hypothetical protein [Glaciimonas immobilis]KAF3999455.1 hypothetical protein HAV38_05935 [Glaciimonas immobilis]MBB5198969.1 hypothetical protein [Glaciimonas immobilis]